MECIFCLNENAYFDGVNYVCPDCGREWPCDEIADATMITISCVALNVARIWSILIQAVLMIMLVMLVGVDGMVTMMTTMKIMTMMKKKINYCNYGAGQIALLLPHYYMLQSEKD